MTRLQMMSRYLAEVVDDLGDGFAPNAGDTNAALIVGMILGAFEEGQSVHQCAENIAANVTVVSA